ncbi:MAG: sugar phosphate isomerase/epimerase [Firmicutes bacterium]|nr:sugar phosphate isomerase/epimerase [Bacillota bacterium]
MGHYRIGCAIPGASFMPEGIAETKSDAVAELLAGAEIVKAAGFDFAESGVGMIMKLTEDEAKYVADTLCEKYGGRYRIESCNSFIPPQLKIIGGEYGIGSPLYEYVNGAMTRMRILGADTVVFGSGGARRIPDGMSRESGLLKIAEFLKMCGELGEKHSVTVAIEPLRAAECNAVNLLSDGISLAKAASHPRVSYLADAFHMYHGGEAADALTKTDVLPVHIHISEPPDRTYPGSHGGDYLKAFAESLKETSYAGRVTVECGFDDFAAEAPMAYEFTHKYF